MKSWSAYCLLFLGGVMGINSDGGAQQLIQNGDFEIQAFDDNDNPVIDGQGNFRPTDWFYADSAPPNPVVTEWVEGEDSDGVGTHAAAIYRMNADWRAPDFAVTEGEVLEVSYDFKFVDVDFLDGFRVDVRFFEFAGAGAGFAGETVKGYSIADFYTAGVLSNGVQLEGISGDGELQNDVWYSARYDATVESTQGPAAMFGDFRASTFFSPSLFLPATVLIDNVSIRRPLGGDFNNDGLYDCNDVDALVAEIAAGGTDTTYDLTGDGLVDTNDLDAWLASAGAVNNDSGAPYLPGDASLDGNVDGTDFLTWNTNKFTPIAAWCAGDFNADGTVDGADFLVWNENKFQTADVSSVPEPSGSLFVMAGCLLCRLTRPRRTGNQGGSQGALLPS